MSLINAAQAGVWGSQPDIGLSADYNSNPALLLDVPHTSETHAALLLDGPTSYVGDGVRFTATPSFRLSNTQGYSSLDSDYQHLTLLGEFDTSRSALTASIAGARDSSLYHDYLLSNGTGVRRETLTEDLNYDRQLSERVEADLDLNSIRVRYATAGSFNTLIDYKYTSLAPTLSWLQSERDKLTIAASFGKYDSLDGTTQSKSANLQLGFIGQLSEIWSLTASGGYSRAQNTALTEEIEAEGSPSAPIIVLIPLKLESTQNGTVFAANLSRKTSQWLLSGIASRQLLPTGFAFLSRQDSYELQAQFTKSERWIFSGDLHRIKYQQPELTGATEELNVTYATMAAVWQWTEHWRVSINGTYVLERIGTPSANVHNSGVSVTLTRQFDFKSLH